MTGESIGTARLDIVVDTSQFDTAITAAKRSVSGMSQAAQEEYNKLNGAEKRRIDSLIKQADTLGFTRQQQILYNAALKGTPTNVLDELKKKLSGTGDAAAKAGIQFNQYGLSQKQTVAAMRQVPAQITDIFTSLQGGQKPLTVLIQQGGQLKDVFGGIRPAAAALGGQLLAMVNPLTVTAALVGALAFAWKQASDEQLAFSNALTATGNFAGKNAADLSELVDQLDRLDDVTRGGAVDALTQVAASGRFAGQQFDLVAEAAARMEAATGQTVDKTVAKFAELQKGPVDALLKLNETEHFLTQTQLDRVAVLQDEGREQEAAAEAIRIYAENLDDVARKAQEAKPALTGMWTDIKNETSSAWGEVKTYISLVAEAIELRTRFMTGDNNKGFVGAFANSLLPSTRLRQITDGARAELAEMRGTAAFQTSSGTRGRGSAGVAVDSAEAKRARDERKKAEEEWNRWQDQNLSKKEKQQQEEAKIVAVGKKLGLDQAKVDEQIAASRARFAESMAKSERKGGSKTDPTEAIIARIKQQIALNEAQLQAEEKLSTSERMRVQVQTELERLGGKATGTRRAEIASLLDQVVASGKMADAHIQEKKALEDLGRLKMQLAAAEQNQSRANEIDLMGIGRGGNAAEMLRRQLDIQRDLEDGLDRINRDAKDKTKDQLAAEEVALRESIGRRLEIERGYQEARAAMQADWKNGAIKAYEDYVEASKNVAGQVEEMWNEAFNTIEDIGVDALSGNLKSWGDYFENLHQMILRFIVKQQLTKWMESLKTGSESGGNGGWFSTLLGVLFSSGSSGNSASSAAQASGDFGIFNPNMPGFAKGAAFTNQVVTQPTHFRFAKGIGLMGEAGPEAIMPLKRGRDGKLGVAAEVMSSGGGDTYHITVPVQGSVDHRTKSQVANETARQVQIASRNR